MDGEPRVRLLLEELLDSERTPEEVCRDCPELLPQVRRRWRRKLACDAQLDAMFPAPEPGAPFGVTAPMPTSAELPQIPGHELLEVLGRGGMGVVYKARHLRLNRTVAVKMLLTGAHASPEARERFLREAEAAAGLRHPNIVQVHDMGDQDGQPYFTMEFVEGGNLAQKLAGTPQPPRQAAALLATLSEAVQAAHRSGIVHRDLKPSNVLLTADGTPKISDFGLARRMEGESGLTWTGIAIGTPSYMAPEQAEARPLAWGPAVDVYALGAILYELLTGRPPFRAETAAETVRQVISQEPVPPSRLNGKVPRDLETICLKCLHKEPRLRYAGAEALAADLRRFLAGEAIAARPDGRLAQAGPAGPPTAGPFGGGCGRARSSRRPCSAAECGWSPSGRPPRGGSKPKRVAAERAAEANLREMVDLLRKSVLAGGQDRPGAGEGVAGQSQGKRPTKPAAARHSRSGTGRPTGCHSPDRIRPSRAIHRLCPNRRGSTKKPSRRRGSMRPTITWRRSRRESGPRISATRWWRRSTTGLSAPATHVASGGRWRWRGWPTGTLTGWRGRARDPAIWKDEAALFKVIEAAPSPEQSTALLLEIGRHAVAPARLRIAFLKRVQERDPRDFWINAELGHMLIGHGKIR